MKIVEFANMADPDEVSSPGFKPHSRQKLFNCKWDSIAHSRSLLLAHHPDMTEILLESM